MPSNILLGEEFVLSVIYTFISLLIYMFDFTCSEDELLHTIPSPSTLTLLRTAFGIEVSDALHELNISDGKLELSGYLSNPCNCLAIKVERYVLII